VKLQAGSNSAWAVFAVPCVWQAARIASDRASGMAFAVSRHLPKILPCQIIVSPPLLDAGHENDRK
jgi:hypothetical protein